MFLYVHKSVICLERQFFYWIFVQHTCPSKSFAFRMEILFVLFPLNVTATTQPMGKKPIKVTTPPHRNQILVANVAQKNSSIHELL